MKVKRFADMMHSLGHEVYLYAGYENEANVTELITVVTEQDQIDWWGEKKWPKDKIFGADYWDLSNIWWIKANQDIATEIRKRYQPKDIVAVIAGIGQKPIADALSDLQVQVVEWGIGYSGIFADYRVYESYAWQAHLAGMYGYDDVRFYDTVIPNSYYPDEFLFEEEPEDYFLYMGRLTRRKGLPIIQEMIDRGIKVKYAGQASDYDLRGAEYMGVVSGQEKKELLSRARAVLVPTTYFEPFGGVSIEAVMSGVPVITTDWGVFPETIKNGVTGFRCSTLKEFMDAAEQVDKLDRETIKTVSQRYSCEVVKHEYNNYFNKLQTLHNNGWYEGV